MPQQKKHQQFLVVKIAVAVVYAFAATNNTLGQANIHDVQKNWDSFETVDRASKQFNLVDLEVVDNVGKDLYWETYGKFILSLY